MEEYAYDEAIRMLVAGSMPVIIEAEDGLHVLSVVPACRKVLEAMTNPDPIARQQFTVNVVCNVKKAVVAGYVS